MTSIHDEEIEFEMNEVQIEIENRMKEKDQMFVEEEQSRGHRE